MATLQTWRRAYGALKDTTKVGLANLNSDFKELDVAIVKATNHVECPPKERHLRKILAATSVARPRADVAYCIHALARRLAKTHNWTVALKTLIVIHRTLREGDPTFREELLNFSVKGRVLQLSNFKDDSSPIAWDCSAWVRTYALFLEERLECFKVLKYDVEAERLSKPADGPEKGHSRTRTLETEDLLDQLPALQQLLYRLIGCRPEGAAASNYVVQYALALVLKESFKVYCAINDGIINLVDKVKFLPLFDMENLFKKHPRVTSFFLQFFEMPRHEAFKALEIYRRSGQQAGSLSDFYESCRGLELARNFQFPNLKEPPRSFLITMEEYIKEAPRVVTASREPLEFPERLLLTYKPEEASPVEQPEEQYEAAETPKPAVIESQPLPERVEVTISQPDNVDLLGLNDLNADASKLEESNSLALAIVPESSTSDNNVTAKENGFDPTGWELALVTTSSNLSTVESTLAGGIDKLTLDSLYDEATYRQRQTTYGAAPQNPFMAPDPFAVSNQVPAPLSVQVATMAQQQQQFQPTMPMMMQPNPFAQPVQLQPNTVRGGAPNPFGDFGFGPFHANSAQQNNPFGTPGLL